jgi:hypothetical protein
LPSYKAIPITRETIKQELADLYDQGLSILFDEVEKHHPEVVGKAKGSAKKEKDAEPAKRTNLHIDYQTWYSKCLPLVETVLPERYREFTEQYKLDKRKEITYATYTISDYMIGLRITRAGSDVVDTVSAFTSKFQLQLSILNSALGRIDSALSDLTGVLQSQLFDSELDAAAHLLQNKHLRASGALAGVTLETHLSHVCRNHKLALTKKDPTIGDFNEKLKEHSVLDIPTWRLIQRLADIRNLCVHSKDRDPKPDEVEDLITGVRKVIASMF